MTAKEQQPTTGVSLTTFPYSVEPGPYAQRFADPTISLRASRNMQLSSRPFRDRTTAA